MPSERPRRRQGPLGDRLPANGSRSAASPPSTPVVLLRNNPVGVSSDEETGAIIIGGHAMDATRQFRNVQANAQVAPVIDDLVLTDPWMVRGLAIRGTAVALSDVDPPVSFMSREVIRITPTWVTAWGLDPGVQAGRPGAGGEAPIALPAVALETGVNRGTLESSRRSVPA